MKKKIFSLLLFVVWPFVSQTNKQTQTNSLSTIKKELIGTWEYECHSKENELLNSTFTLQLKIRKGKLFGNYCAVARNGNKIDCSIDEENNLSGKFKGKKNQINFYSFFGAKNGKAVIEIINSKKIKWKIVKAPNGECYAPNDCVLTK